MKSEILQYIEEVKIDDRLKIPFKRYYSDRLIEYRRMTYFTLKELQELYYNRALYSNYNTYFFNHINDFFDKNIHYKTSAKDILICINSYHRMRRYYSILVL